MLRNNVLLILILGIGLALRLYKIDLPLLEFYPSRQVQTADITRNFIKNEFNLFNPTISYLGSGYTPFLFEFSGYNFVIATFYYIFGINEIIGRLLSIFGWLVAVVLIYKIGLELGLKRIAAYSAVLFYTFSPLSVLISRSFQPDQWMITMSLAGIYFILRWYTDPKIFFFILSSISVSISALLKVPSLIFTVFPVMYVIYKLNGKLLDSKKLIYLATVAIPSFFWYLFAISTRQSQAAAGASSVSNWFGLEVFLNTKYYSNIFGFEYNLVLLPVGIILFLIGTSTKLKKGQSFLYWWLGSIILYFLIFNKHNMTHEYYHLPLLPIATIFIGIGAQKVFEKFNNLILSRGWILVIISFVIFALMLPPTISRAYKPIDRFRFVPETAAAIQRLTKPNDLIIGSMDAGPTLVYYAKRNGWAFDINRENSSAQLSFYGMKDQEPTDVISDLENLRKQRAMIFASAYKSQFLSNKRFADYMYQNYHILEETDDYIIFDITSPLLGT